MMPIISVNKLRKTYRTFNRRPGLLGSVKDLFYRNYQTLTAVNEISFSVEEGELVGYIGPNGAGKSTSIKMLTGILRPTSGDMQVLGFHPFADRKQYVRHIGVVFGQRSQLWWDIAVQESFRLLKKIYRVSDEDYRQRLEKLSAILDLDRLMGTPVRKLSLGERMRCDLAASLLHQPRILFLDEPTIGLDAIGKDGIRSFLRQVNTDFGTTIILTTHDLREIEELCRRILVIDRGTLVYDGLLSHIKNLPGLKRMLTVDFNGAVPFEQLQHIFDGRLEFVRQGERRLSCSFDPQASPPAEIIRSLMNSFDISDLILTEPSIEDVIMKIYREGAAND